MNIKARDVSASVAITQRRSLASTETRGSLNVSVLGNFTAGANTGTASSPRAMVATLSEVTSATAAPTTSARLLTRSVCRARPNLIGANVGTGHHVLNALDLGRRQDLP